MPRTPPPLAVALLRYFVFSSGLCLRFETEVFSETCSFSIAGCEKITRS